MWRSGTKFTPPPLLLCNLSTCRRYNAPHPYIQVHSFSNPSRRRVSSSPSYTLPPPFRQLQVNCFVPISAQSIQRWIRRRCLVSPGEETRCEFGTNENTDGHLHHNTLLLLLLPFKGSQERDDALSTVPTIIPFYRSLMTHDVLLLVWTSGPMVWLDGRLLIVLPKNHLVSLLPLPSCIFVQAERDKNLGQH